MNESVGGTTAQWGLDNFDSLIVPQATSSDLLVIAFGMNGSEQSPENYENTIKQIMDKYHYLNPNGGVVLVSPMLISTYSTWIGNQETYENNLNHLESVMTNVASAPVGSFYRYMINSGKESCDFLSNNINHPDDFGVRVYAQIILQTILGEV